MVKGVEARLIIQHCFAAKLQTQFPDRRPISNQIGRGFIVFVKLFENANSKTILKIVEAIMSLRICINKEKQVVSIVDLPGDVLLIPQFPENSKRSPTFMTSQKKIFEELIRACQNRFIPENPTRRLLGAPFSETHKLSVVTTGVYGNVVEV